MLSNNMKMCVNNIWLVLETQTFLIFNGVMFRNEHFVQSTNLLINRLNCMQEKVHIR